MESCVGGPTPYLDFTSSHSPNQGSNIFEKKKKTSKFQIAELEFGMCWQLFNSIYFLLGIISSLGRIESDMTEVT